MDKYFIRVRKEYIGYFEVEAENLKEADQNLNTNTESITKFNVQKSTIIKRKTVFINNKYITYTLIVYPL